MSARDFTDHFGAIYVCRFDEEARRRQLLKEKPVPVGLALESADGAGAGAGSGSAASCLGLYKRVAGMEVHGAPCWRHTAHSDRWLAFSGSAWNVQRGARLGAKLGWLSLEASAQSRPDEVDKHWLATDGGGRGWEPRPDISCRKAEASELPPPIALRLEGAESTDAAKLMGLYRLLPGEEANGRPVWAALSKRKEVLAFNGHSWMVQRKPGAQGGYLSVSDESLTPDLCEDAWEAPVEGEWVAQPAVRCREVDLGELPPPEALLLRLTAAGAEGSLHRAARACLGLYKLVPGRQEGGRPVWRHASESERWLAFAAGSWCVQPAEGLGTRAGWLALDDAACATPALSRGHAWEAGRGEEGGDTLEWAGAASIECVEPGAPSVAKV